MATSGMSFFVNTIDDQNLAKACLLVFLSREG